MCNKKHYIVAILMGLSLIGTAQADQSSFSNDSQASYLTQVNVAEQDQPTSLDLDFNNSQHDANFEQVQSADDGETRVNVAMNFALPKKDELNLRVGALSLEFPEDSNKPLEVDVRPFFFVGIGKNW